MEIKKWKKQIYGLKVKPRLERSNLGLIYFLASSGLSGIPCSGSCSCSKTFGYERMYRFDKI